MNPTAKIHITGHRGLIGSAKMRNLQAKGYTKPSALHMRRVDKRSASTLRFIANLNIQAHADAPLGANTYQFPNIQGKAQEREGAIQTDAGRMAQSNVASASSPYQPTATCSAKPNAGADVGANLFAQSRRTVRINSHLHHTARWSVWKTSSRKPSSPHQFEPHPGREARAENIVINGMVNQIRFSSVMGRAPLENNEMRFFEEVANARANKIVSKWIDFFVLNKPIKPERITRRLK